MSMQEVLASGAVWCLFWRGIWTASAADRMWIKLLCWHPPGLLQNNSVAQLWVNLIWLESGLGVKLWFEDVRRQLFMHRPFALRRSVTNALASRTRNHFLYLICMGCNPGTPPPNLTGRLNLIQVAILVPVHFARISLGGFLVGITSATAVQ